MRTFLLVGLVLTVLGALLAIVGGLLAALRSPSAPADPGAKSTGLPVLVIGLLLMVVVGPGSCAIGCAPAFLPQLWLPKVARNGDAIVSAIRRFESDAGHSPATLDDLVPAYLPVLPPTGYPKSDEWEYRLQGTSWTLCAPIESIAIDFDEFRYEPSGSTRVPVGYKRVVRQGDWLYMDE